MNRDFFFGMTFGAVMTMVIMISFLFGGYMSLNVLLNQGLEPRHRIEVFK